MNGEFRRLVLALLSAAMIANGAHTSYPPQAVAAEVLRQPAPSIALARGLIEVAEFDHALTVLKQLDVTDDSAAPQIDLLVGRIFLSIGKPGKALEYFERASFASHDVEAEANLAIAEAKLALGELTQARRSATLALQGDPDLVGAHLVLASADQRIGHGAEAMAQLRKLQSERPESGGLAIVVARYLTQQDGPAAGLHELDAFLSRHPDAPAVLNTRAQLLWANGQAAEAVTARRKVAQIYRSRGENGRADALTMWIAAVEPPLPPPQAAKTKPMPPAEQIRPARPVVQAARSPHPAAVLARPEPLPFAPGSAIMTGSGIVVEGGRQIVTNRHVIEGAREIAVRNGTGHVRKARLAKVSPDDDLALLEIDSPFPEGAATAFADLVDPAPGRAAIVMGYPLIGVLGDEQPALTEGIVAKTLGLGNDANTFQMTAKVNKGNSGGPVFDKRGRLLGVAVGKMDSGDIAKKNGTQTEDMNIGIKASRILRFLGKTARPSPQGRPEMSLEDLYQNMLPKAVLVATQK